MDSPSRGFAENPLAKLLVLVAAFIVAFLAAYSVSRSGRAFRSLSAGGQLLEFPVGSPAGMLIGFASQNVILAAIAGWLVYLPLAVAITRSNRRGMVIGGIVLFIALLVLNVLMVFLVAGLNSLR